MTMLNAAFFSTFDLKSAYHQAPLKVLDRNYTAFEANGHLLQFCRILFGVKNRAILSQRAIDKIIKKIRGAFPYIDYITICRMHTDRTRPKWEKVPGGYCEG